MIRRIIKIDEEKCNGCGACANACHEGAIDMVNGKAKLMRENYCDGLGDCLPACPTGAITFEEREAPAYDEAAVMASKKENAGAAGTVAQPHVGCPGSMARTIKREAQSLAGAQAHVGCPGSRARAIQRDAQSVQMAQNAEGTQAAVPYAANSAPMTSQLAQWPVQIKLVPVKAPYYDGANLLIAADCTAYAYANFHNDFIRNHIAIIGCPKLDSVDYSEKLTAIIAENNIKSVTIVRMEVPCCGGLENAAKNALRASGKFIPWQVVTISTDGRILDR